jgi:DNA gyrase/topoisomerase IV subunit A
MHPPDDALRQRLEILDAFVATIDRRVEVFDLIADSASADEAQTGIAALLGISDIAAGAVLDLQARRFTRGDRQRIVDERAELKRTPGA